MTEIDQIIDGVIAPEVTGESTPLVSNETEKFTRTFDRSSRSGKEQRISRKEYYF